MQKQPFSPGYGSGQTLTVTTTSQTVNINKDSKNVCLTNTGTGVAYVRCVPDGSPATAADFPILPSQQRTITKSELATTLAVVGAASTTLHIMTGEGFMF